MRVVKHRSLLLLTCTSRGSYMPAKLTVNILMFLLSVFVSWMTFIFSNFHWLTKQLFSYRFILFARFWRGEMNICSYYQYTFYTWKLFSYLSLDRIKQTFYLIRQMFAKKRDNINPSWNINYYFACWNLPFLSVKLT